MITNAENNTLLDAAIVSLKHGIPLSTHQYKLLIDLLRGAAFNMDRTNDDQWMALQNELITMLQGKFTQGQQPAQ